MIRGLPETPDLNLLEILLEIVKLKRKIANLQIEIVKFRKY